MNIVPTALVVKVPQNLIDPLKCGSIAGFNPKNDKCWLRNQGKGSSACGTGAFNFSRSTQSFTGVFCACDTSKALEGNGYDCTQMCSPEQTDTVPNSCYPQQCIIQNDQPVCGCSSGFSKNETGGRCYRLKNNCDTCEFNCHLSQECINSPDIYGGDAFTCSPCNKTQGFIPTSSGGISWCANNNECLDGSHMCSDRATCHDKDPSRSETWGIKYTCICGPGFTGEGTKCNECVDINECSQPNICGNNSICENTIGSYTCKCKPGYSTATQANITYNGAGHQDCINIDECKTLTQPCKVHSHCKDTDGSWECSCDPGFVGEGKIKGCSPDASVCKKCDKASTDCVLNQAHAAYQCVCKNFFNFLNSTHCTARTYCDKPSQIKCAPGGLSICTDFKNGSGYSCKCNDNADDVGVGKNAKKGYQCLDKNPCIRRKPCDLVAYTVCKQTLGIGAGYECNCLPGYIRQLAGYGNNSAPCYQIGGGLTYNCSQCNPDSERCDAVKDDPNIKQYNNITLYSCVCQDGYTRPTGVPVKVNNKYAQDGVCTNINECKIGAHNCDPVRAECIDDIPTVANNYTKFHCQCLHGFTGNGTVGNCKNINECNSTDYRYPCDSYSQDCIDRSPGYECVCKKGFMNDPNSANGCIDQNECELAFAACNPYASCNNTVGSYTCYCDKYKNVKPNGTVNEKGPVCVPINQCKEGRYGDINLLACPTSTHICEPDGTNVICSCPVGYKQNGRFCDDVIECRDEQHNGCDQSTTNCINTIGLYVCVCKNGFQLPPDKTNGTARFCIDINECNKTAPGYKDPCYSNSTCHNSRGGYRCVCDDGFEPLPGSSGLNPLKPQCIPANPCAKFNPCFGGDCIYDRSTAPFYKCRCNEGFAIHNKTTCIDSKYCDVTDYYSCPENSQCLGKTCACNVGYKWVDVQQPFTIDKLKTRKCEPIDWCQTYGILQCGERLCKNTPEKAPGSGECYCDKGFTVSPDGNKCKDFNECAQGNYSCNENSHCYNTKGSYACHCNDGYYALPGSDEQKPICGDVDECLYSLDNCTEHTKCRNTNGSFECDCIPGYKREQIGGADNGRLSDRPCIKQDPCDPNPCDPNPKLKVKCDGSSGCAVCTCPDGFTGVGTKELPCQDKHECEMGHHNCTEGIEKCVDLYGGFRCDCAPGYKQAESGSPRCKDRNECMEQPGICGDPKTKKCVNIIGSYLCECKNGFLDAGNSTCVDKNECSISEICGPLPANLCNNTYGSYVCSCAPGYEKPCKDSDNCPSKCIDIDECKRSDPCGPNALCKNTPGAYICYCKDEHYYGDPYNKTAGCKFNDTCTCQKNNSHCIIINENSHLCVCDKGFIDVDGFCKPDPCYSTFKCDGGQCSSRVLGPDIITECYCPPHQVYNNKTGQCVDSNVCKCTDGNLTCVNSTVCSDRYVQNCVPLFGEANCICRDYLVKNEKTGKCESRQFCPKKSGEQGAWPCPTDATCKELYDEFGNQNSRICICNEHNMIWKQDSRPEYPGKCVIDSTCSRQQECQEFSNAYCNPIKGQCICNNSYTMNYTTHTCQRLDSCKLFREQYGFDQCEGVAISDGRGPVCECQCPSGYRKESQSNKTTCIDNNECLSHPCTFNKSAPFCINTNGSYYCTCNGTAETSNYIVDKSGICGKPDLCKKRGPCPSNSDCIPSTGQCVCRLGWNGPKPPGTEKQKEVICTNENECISGPPNCPLNSYCNDTEGSFECICNKGYKKRKSLIFDFECVDIDECKETINACSNDTRITCDNTPGSYICKCGQNLQQLSNFQCAEQLTSTCGNCSEKASCARIVGSSSALNCTCVAGYEGNGQGKDGCTAIKYCQRSPRPCDPINAMCTDLDPGFNCTCRPGYYGNGIGSNGCKRDSFCIPGRNPCPRLSECKEKSTYPKIDFGAPWSSKDFVTCKCPEGWIFNEKTFVCEDVDECKEKKQMRDADHTPCPKNSTCINTQGGFMCNCGSGFKYNKAANDCDDINECITGEAESCKPGTGTCGNTIGSWHCNCLPGFKNPNNTNKICEYEDRCKTPLNPCNSNNSECYDSFSVGLRCKCFDGWQQSPDSPTKCVDINECAYPNECNSLTEYCDNYDGGYKCVCRENYTFSNGRCVPLIPCKDPCPDYSICVLDRNNKSSCKCIDHYSWVDSNKTCSIVACKNTNCGEGGKCVVVQNRNQSLERAQLPYRCECEPGYIFDDIHKLCRRGSANPCKNDTCGIGICQPASNEKGYTCTCPGTGCWPSCSADLCDPKAECRTAERNNKTVLSYCVCKDGYRGFGTTTSGCFPTTTCDDMQCSKWAACQIVNGTPTCVCDKHYIGNGTWCVDFDECLNKTDNCDENASCLNVQGGFVCTCKPGYTGVGTKGNCPDIDECDNSGRWDMRCDLTSTTCNNTIGSYKCDCKPGYRNTTFPFLTCPDINECLENKTICGIHKCQNLEPGYKCNCLIGFKPDVGEHSCSDTDECKLGLDDCDKQNGVCVNTVGSYQCKCKEGFTGDGKKCEVIDKCNSTDLNKCDPSTTKCVMIPYTVNYLCKCNSGYKEPTGQSEVHSCEDINECLNGSLFDLNSVSCINDPGSYKLECKLGFTGLRTDSRGKAVCDAKNECTEDPAWLETMAVVQKGNVKMADWKTWMVPPKNKSSAYGICYYEAINNNRQFSGIYLPGCQNLDPGVTMTTFNTAGGFSWPTGWGCACADGTIQLKNGHRAECDTAVCNCENQNPDLTCRPNTGQCICKKPELKLRTINGKVICSNVECDADYQIPEKLRGNSLSKFIYCQNNTFYASVGYRLVRDQYTQEVVDIVDINECESAENPCCMGNCTGSFCITCVNTPGSYNCVFKKGNSTALCEVDGVDKAKCECTKTKCEENEAWYWSCLRGFNATVDPRLNDPANKKQLCSRILDFSTMKFIAFPSLKAFYGYIAALPQENQNAAACFYDVNSTDLTTSPLFNYWGPCSASVDDVTCVGGGKAVLKTYNSVPYPFCPVRYQLRSLTPAVSQAGNLEYSRFPFCLYNFKSMFLSGSLVYFNDSTADILY